jgi:hypothetical protein
MTRSASIRGFPPASVTLWGRSREKEGKEGRKGEEEDDEKMKKKQRRRSSGGKKKKKQRTQKTKT